MWEWGEEGREEGERKEREGEGKGKERVGEGNGKEREGERRREGEREGVCVYVKTESRDKTKSGRRDTQQRHGTHKQTQIAGPLQAGESIPPASTASIYRRHQNNDGRIKT